MQLQEGCGFGSGVLLRLKYLQGGYIKFLDICGLGGSVLLRLKYLQVGYIKFLNICGLGGSVLLRLKYLQPQPSSGSLHPSSHPSPVVTPRTPPFASTMSKHWRQESMNGLC